MTYDFGFDMVFYYKVQGFLKVAYTVKLVGILQHAMKTNIMIDDTHKKLQCWKYPGTGPGLKC